MRMRRMRNLEPRTEKCAAYRIAEPEARKGHWRALKPNCTALWVEVGCGKGKFTAETAQANATPGKPNTMGMFMKYFFPLMSLWICCTSSAGFSIYWLTSNVIAILQSVFINKYFEKKEAKAKAQENIQ